MGAVGVVVLTLDGVQQGEGPLRGQGGLGQHDLKQHPHLGHGQGRIFFPRAVDGRRPGSDARESSG